MLFTHSLFYINFLSRLAKFEAIPRFLNSSGHAIAWQYYTNRVTQSIGLPSSQMFYKKLSSSIHIACKLCALLAGLEPGTPDYFQP